MDRLERSAIIIALIDRLKERGSWCGETHIQKAIYFLQELAGLQLGYRFVLYKHGPYSFDLNDEITAMRADALVRVEPQPHPYGPSLAPDDAGRQVERRYARAIAACEPALGEVADRLGPLGVVHLERLATALFVSHEAGMPRDLPGRAARLHALKPHVSAAEAAEALAAVDRMLAQMRPGPASDVAVPRQASL
jgi:hypothetical protein